jgi:hypothetical protein
MRARQWRFLSAIVVGLLAVSNQAMACEQPNGNDTVPDTQAIQCLLDQGGTVVLDADVSNGYYIDATLNFSVSGTTLTSSSAYGNRALLIASPGLNTPMLVVPNSGVSNYTISKIWFYGNKFSRTAPNCSGDQSDNAHLRGSYFLIDDVESDQAPCESGMVIDGSDSWNYEVRNSWFAYNGFQQGTAGHDSQWSDGLTVGSCVNSYIHDNHFVDNTDVDLVVGGGYNCTIAYNTINHYSNHGFAGIHVGWFPGLGNGDHSGINYYGNNISSQADELAFGLMVGYHPWGSSITLASAGAVFSNNTSGSVVPLAIDGIYAGSVTGNSYSSAQGSWGYYCTASMNYGGGHIFGGTVDDGYVSFVWDDGSCHVP